MESAPAAVPPPTPDLSGLSDDQLLGLRFRDLPVRIEGTWLQRQVARLRRELKRSGIAFQPKCYLADEWLTPDGEPVVGIPFYLAHPRLRRLERKLMLEVEGGDVVSCMRLLRHETGHALNYAYRLHRRTRWRELFGPYSADYPERYRYRPYSKRFVRHLEGWYAQYHPDEDFAETFAVWLDPHSDWRNRYRGWGALEKLEYVDRLMREIGPRDPLRPTGQKLWDITRLKTTLKTHYRRRRDFYAEYYPDFHDFHLQRIFPRRRRGGTLPAAGLIRQHRGALLDDIALCTGERKFVINDLLSEIIVRCEELNLGVGHEHAEALMRVAAYATSLTMNYIYTGRYKREKK